MERRLVFNDIAGLYDAVRPSYPSGLVDDVIATADMGPADRILEVGCGTGLATRSFAERGHAMLALDPGAHLLAVARRKFASLPNVAFAHTSFEDWSPERGAFKLVLSAQSWHWVAPDVRFAKAADALAPSGWLAVFGNQHLALAGPLQSALDDIYARRAPSILEERVADVWFMPQGPLPGLFDQSGRFGPARHSCYRWDARLSAASFAALQSTYSSHRMLEPDVRERLLADIVAAIEAQGGSVDLPYETHLHMARRAD